MFKIRGMSRLFRVKNLLTSLVTKRYSSINYVVENANWVIKWEGTYITKNVEKLFNIKSTIVTNPSGIKNQILHFGSRGLYVPNAWRNFDRSNKIIFTWYHGNKNDPDPNNLAMIDDISIASNICEFIHTTANKTKELLIEWGVPKNKIVVITEGIDLTLFKPTSKEIKEKIRKDLKIPEESVCVGSFQKDGVGWEEGNEPKLIKGPDVFCDVVVELSKEYPIYVLLIGPARGYVKKRLADAGIPFYHKYLENFQDIPKYYHALDLYLVTSREEGGPKAIVESMASGIPIISTKVGMAPDIIKDGCVGFLTDIENVDGLVEKAGRVIEDGNLRDKLINNALNAVKDYSWENITREYHKKIYSKLLS